MSFIVTILVYMILVMEQTNTVELAAKVIARTASVNAASKKSGIPVDELRRLQREDIDFNALVLEHRTKNVMRTAVAIQRAGPLAVKVLTEELSITPGVRKVRRGRPPKDDKYKVTKEVSPEPDPRRIRAAKIILELFLKATEIVDLASRIAVLEQQVGRRDIVVTAEPLPLE